MPSIFGLEHLLCKLVYIPTRFPYVILLDNPIFRVYVL